MKRKMILYSFIFILPFSLLSLTSCEKSGKKIKFDVYGGKYDYEMKMDKLIESLGRELKLYRNGTNYYDTIRIHSYNYERYEYKNVYKNQNGVKTKEINEFEENVKFDISNLILYSFSKTYELSKNDAFYNMQEFEEELQYEFVNDFYKKYNITNDTYETKYYVFPKSVKLNNVIYKYDDIYDDDVKYYKDGHIFTIHIKVEDLLIQDKKKDSENNYITFTDTIDYEYLFQFYNANSTSYYKFYEYKNVITEYEYNGIKMKNEETSIFKAYEKLDINSIESLKRCDESKFIENIE